jgi:hypothetical protein
MSDLPPENCTRVNESSPGYKSPRRTRNEAEPVYGGADHRGLEASGSGDQDGGDLPAARDQQHDILQVEGEVGRLRGQ